MYIGLKWNLEEKILDIGSGSGDVTVNLLAKVKLLNNIYIFTPLFNCIIALKQERQHS